MPGYWISIALSCGMIVLGAAALFLALFMFMAVVGASWPPVSWFGALLSVVVAVAGLALVSRGVYRFFPSSQAHSGADGRAMARAGGRSARPPRPFLLLWLYYGIGHFVTASVLGLFGSFILPRWIFTAMMPLPVMFSKFVMSYWGSYQPGWPPIVQTLFSAPFGWLLILINSALYGAVLAWLHVALRR